MAFVKVVHKFVVARRGPTLLPAGCERDMGEGWRSPSITAPYARIVAVGVQLVPDERIAGSQEAFWRDEVVVWVERCYPFGGILEPAQTPVNLSVVTTGRVIDSPGAEYVGTAQLQRDDYNNGAPLVLHVYRHPAIRIEMHEQPVHERVVGPGAMRGDSAARVRS